MSLTITDLFYANGGYVSDSAFSASDVYVAPSTVTGTYLPIAVSHLNSLCMTTVSVDYTASSSGDPSDDLILAELCLSIADNAYDNLHVDPDTGKTENRHWTMAYRYMLNMYGISVKGAFGKKDLLLPKEAVDNTGYSGAWPTLSVATMTS